jgi:glucosamine--fructose-6-phosphate aminotransferase (isomerizing)
MSGSIITSEISQIPAIFSKLNESDAIFNQAVAQIRDRKINNVILVARGTSGHAALFLKTLIETELGLPVGIASPSAVSINGAKLNYENTLVIGLSQSGQSPDLLSYLEAAKVGGALLIAMTNDANSPMAKLADIHIDLLAEKERALAATKSYSAQLFASLKLIRIWQERPADFGDASDRLTELLTDNEISDSLITKIANFKNLVFIGRGYGFANAREGSLKIQETCYRFVQGFSAADYVHGPMAAVDKDSCVFVVAPTGSQEKGLEKAVTSTRERGAQIIWIGSGGFSESNEIVIAGAISDDQALNCVIDASLLQILAVKLALKLGNNPDVSRGLEKVTLTF